MRLAARTASCRIPVATIQTNKPPFQPGASINWGPALLAGVARCRVEGLGLRAWALVFRVRGLR